MKHIAAFRCLGIFLLGFLLFQFAFIETGTSQTVNTSSSPWQTNASSWQWNNTQTTTTSDNTSSPPDDSLIRADRTVLWSGNVGVTGDIPRDRVPCTTPECFVLATGFVDSATINRAIASAPDNTVVRIPEGTFLLTSSIKPKSRVTLQGAGMGRTVLRGANGFSGDGLITSEAVSLYLNDQPSYDLYRPAKGDSTITTLFPHDWRVGDYIHIDMLEDPIGSPKISVGGGEGNSGSSSCRNPNIEVPGIYCHAVGQTVRIAAILSSTQATIDTPLYWSYTKSPQATKVSSYYLGVAVEDLTLDNSLSMSDKILNLENSMEGWVLRVEFIAESGSSIFLYGTTRFTIRSCTFHETNTLGSGGGYTILLWNRATANLIEDNIIYHEGIGVLLNGGVSGNVIAYNYLTDFVYGNWAGTGIGSHSAHPMMNLFEGNQMETRFRFDFTHGTTAYNTLFRNRITNETSPAVDSARNLIDLWAYATYTNIIGNVLGTLGQESIYAEKSGPIHQLEKVIYSFGEIGIAQNRGQDGGASFSTVYRQGNWDSVNNAVMWDEDGAASSRSMPNSLYLTATPAWFGSCTWPAIGPDLNIMTNDIPAKRRFENRSCSSSGNIWGGTN